MQTDTEPTNAVRDVLLGGTCDFSELKAALGCSPRKLEYMIREGLPVFYVGRTRRFVLETTREWLLRTERQKVAA